MTALPASIAAFYENRIDVVETTGDDIIAALHTEATRQFWTAVENVKTIRRKRITAVATSHGKDSTLTLLIALQAHEKLMAEGVLDSQSPFIVTNIDTGVEAVMGIMLARYSRHQLEEYCREKSINLQYRVGTPPLAKQYAALYFSGLKIISTGRTNADCSEIMKVDTAEHLYRALEADYGTGIVTLLGSRTSESATRAASIRRRGHHTLTAEDLLMNDDNGRKVFLPIVDMSDEALWYCLQHAGTNPIRQLPDGGSLPSYADNHRILRLLYRDSTTGEEKTCPESAIKLKGVGTPGGCGGSSRSGCYLCTRIQKDKSSNKLNELPRFGVFGKNAERVRNWIYVAAQDSRYRTWHSRAIDPITNAVAMTPNVLRGEVYSDALKLLSQLAFDDAMRAERFQILLKADRVMEDEGYADIANDSELNEEDRSALLSLYVEMAQTQIINPMTLETAIYLSMCHARDGVTLPPYHAVAVYCAIWAAKETARSEFLSGEHETFWNALEAVKARQEADGTRLPYPDVDPGSAVISEIPDSKMLFPPAELRVSAAHLDAIAFELDAQIGCTLYEKANTHKLPLERAMKRLSPAERVRYGDTDPKMQVALSYHQEIQIGETLRETPVKTARTLKNRNRNPYSKRAIKKVSRRGGKLRVLERGRTSIDTPSFALRPIEPDLASALKRPISILVPCPNRSIHWFATKLEDIDYTGGSYDIDHEGLVNWLQFDGLERALAEHDRVVADLKRRKKSIFTFQGTQPFFELLRNGVLSLTDKARINAYRILSRTDYFRTLGIYDCDQKELLDNAMPMAKYRRIKAETLLEIRAQRNAKRKELKAAHQAYWRSPLEGEKKQAVALADQLVGIVQQAAFKASISEFLLTKYRGFDTIDYGAEFHANTGLLAELSEAFTSAEAFLKFSAAERKVAIAITEDLTQRLDLLAAVKRQKKRILAAHRRGIREAIETLGDTSLYTESWRAMFIATISFGQFGENDIEQHQQKLRKDLEQLDKAIREAGELDFANTFSMADESATALLASNLF